MPPHWHDQPVQVKYRAFRPAPASRRLMQALAQYGQSPEPPASRALTRRGTGRETRRQPRRKAAPRPMTGPRMPAIQPRKNAVSRIFDRLE
jgi:hypothetical protein